MSEYVNQSTVYQDRAGPEPDTTLPNGWRLWSTWFRRYSNSCWSNGTIDENGWVHYHKILKSQRTWQIRTANFRDSKLYYITGTGYAAKGPRK